jgi:hypothetical protein
LFGLHQGRWDGNQAGQDQLNRGVPLARVIEDIHSRYGDLPALDPAEAPTWNLGGAKRFGPIIGTGDFQAQVWRSALGGHTRIFLLRGEPGSGKSYCIDVLSALLPEGSHQKVIVSAELLAKQDAQTLAGTIATVASASLEPLVSIGEYGSTSCAWVRDEVITKLVRAMNNARGGRDVWLCIKDLNEHRIEGAQAEEFLLLLYDQVRSSSWLHVVLDGMQGDLPAHIEDFAEPSYMQRVTKLDLEAYVLRFFASVQINMESTAVDMVVDLGFQIYSNMLAQQPARALRTLSEAIRGMLGKFLPPVNAL